MSGRYSFDMLFDSLRNELLGGNFRLESHSWSPGRPCADLVADTEALREEILMQARLLEWPAEIIGPLGSACGDRFSSGLLAAHAFALNLFRIAEDNWFSFQRARDACAWFEDVAYLSQRRELVLFKKVDIRPLFSDLAVAPDLPLVADLGEDTLHLVLAGLAD